MSLVVTDPPDEADVPKLLATLEADLGFLFEDNRVPQLVQAKVAALGLTSSRLFARAADDLAGVRRFTAELGLDIAANVQNRVAGAALVNAWEASKIRLDKRLRDEAEVRATDLPKSLPKSQHLELIRAFTAKHKELEDRDLPANQMVDSLLEQVEEGEIVAEKLSSTLSKAQTSGEVWGSCKIQPDGTMKVAKGRQEGTMPTDSEDLRARYRLLARAWELVRMKVPHKPFLKDYSMKIFDDLVEWLLSSDVYRTEIKSPDGTFTYRPTWGTLLDFEYEVRRWVARKLNSNASLTLSATITQAMQDTALIQKHFTNKVNIGAGAAAAIAAAPERAADRSRTPANRPSNPEGGRGARSIP